MKRYLSLLGCLLALTAAAQDRQPHCKSSATTPASRVTVAAPEEDDYDLHHIFLDLHMDNMSRDVRGMGRLDGRVVAPSMPVFAFELDSLHTIDSLKLNGQLMPVQTFATAAPGKSMCSRKVFLTSALPQHALFSAEVHYHLTGGPNAPASSLVSPYAIKRGGPGIGWCTYTFSEPYAANTWWPTKQSLRDKIDSADIWITVPDSLKAGSNGLLRQVTPVGAGFHRYEWQTKYPMAYYLVSVAIADYQDLSSYMHFTGSSDSMLVQNYIWSHLPNPAPGMIDSLPFVINFFSSLCGRYPFWKEKYGQCFTLSPSMENQTMSSIAHPGAIWHELAHQWFGDHVTCGTWHDLWLNEGWASYLEDLAYEATGVPVNWAQRMNATGMDTSLYVIDTSSSSLPPGVYGKGEAVARMLRCQAPDDSLFITALKNYQNSYGGGTATTEDLQAVFEMAYGTDLDTFFNQWVYGSGYPVYQVRYAQTATQTVLKLVQTPTRPQSVPCFVTPLEIKLRSPQGDTTIKIHTRANMEYYVLDWNKPLTPGLPIDVDPGNCVLLKELSAVNDPAILGVAEQQAVELKCFPNPAGTGWQVSPIPSSAELRLTDLAGKELWSGAALSETVIVPGDGLSAGIYLLQVRAGNGVTGSYKLIKQ